MKKIILIIAGILFSFSFTFAYLAGGQKWNDGDLPVVYRINVNGTPDCTDEFTAIQSALQTWEDECRSYWDITYSGTTTATAIGVNDGQNVIRWVESATEPLYASLGSGVIAANFRIWVGTRLVDADIAFNGVDFTWGTGGEPTRMDVQTIALHELGHSLRLRDMYPAVNGPKVMYGYGDAGLIKHSLHQDDRDGIAYIYPTNTNDRVWIQDAPDDFGCVPYSGGYNAWWSIDDIRFVPYPPHVGSTCTIYVTGRNMYPTAQAATITVEVHDPDVNLNAGPPFLWSSTQTDQTIKPSGDSLLEGKREFSFSWPVSSSSFDEGHYCVIATVQTAGDIITNPWPPADNDVACHNINISEALSVGKSTYFTFNAGNPTGVPVTMTLHVDRKNQPKGWRSLLEQYPEDQAIPLDKGQTLLPIKLLLAPEQAADGEFAEVNISSILERQGTREQIGGGGITARGIVGEPHDVGITGLDLPTDLIDPNTPVNPKATVKNFRTYAEEFPVECTIDDGSAYADTQTVKLGDGEEKSVLFKEWSAVGGGHTVVVRTLHPMDAFPENNAQSGGIGVYGMIDKDTTRSVVEPITPPKAFEFAPCRPNPSGRTVSLSYALPIGTSVSLKVYDVAGNLVKRLVEGYEPAGVRQLVWDGMDTVGKSVHSGVYFIRFETPNYQANQKIILIR
jgi:hypothetical protein